MSVASGLTLACCPVSSKRQASASKKTVFASEQDRPDVACRREQWEKYQGRLDPARQGQPTGSKLDAHEACILELVENEKDIARHEIADKLLTERGVRTCAATVWYFFSKRGLTHKKRQRMPRNNSARMSSPGGRSGSTARRSLIPND